MRELKSIKISLFIVILLLMISLVSAELSVPNSGFLFLTQLDSELSNTGIIGNTYTFYVSVRNSFDYNFNFTLEQVVIETDFVNDLFTQPLMIYPSSCQNCSIPLNETDSVTFAYNWTPSNISGARTFSLMIGDEPVTFSDGYVGVNSIMNEVIEMYDDVDVLVSGNTVEINLTGINFSDTVFEWININYGSLNSLYNWADIWMDFDILG